MLKILGWKTTGRLPDDPKYVLIVAYHTSNWDFFYGLLLALSLRLETYWLGKHVLFQRPFTQLIRWLGGIPVDRSKTGNTVHQIVQNFNDNEKLVISMSPEGTRSRVESWKTGFYYIALKAKVPILMGFLDYKHKTGGVIRMLHPTGDINADMKVIVDFYNGVTARYPEKQ